LGIAGSWFAPGGLMEGETRLGTQRSPAPRMARAFAGMAHRRNEHFAGAA
jgi:hypothetical protein